MNEIVTINRDQLTPVFSVATLTCSKLVYGIIMAILYETISKPRT